MAGQVEAADERGGFAFDSDLDIDVVEAPEPVEQAPAAQQSAPADAPKQDDGDDDLDRASSLDELKAALKKRSPTKEDRSAIDARLAGVSKMERELLELRAWRKAQEEAKVLAKKEEEKPVDEWDEMLGKGPEYIRRVAAELAKKEVEAAMQEVAKLRGELTEREQRAEYARQSKSRQGLLQKHPDAHEKLLKFRDLVQQYPQLEEQALSSEDPASFAYEQVQRYERLSQYKSYEEFIQGEAARLAGQPATVSAAPAQQPAAVPQKAQRRAPLTLAAVRGGNAAALADDSDHFPNF